MESGKQIVGIRHWQHGLPDRGGADSQAFREPNRKWGHLLLVAGVSGVLKFGYEFNI
jgi:hypothetical protein